MKKYKRRTRLAALTLAAVFLLALLLPCAVLAVDASVITIRSAEDLERLSQSCALDTWSQGKTVVLTADIDLNGADFTPIPTFGGTFEGGGHTVSGLSLSEGTAYQGLFRYIQEGGVVRNLHVTGDVSAVGEQACLGGIAGSNEGTILDCSFQGTVTGKLQTGGIAGVNEATGAIYRCTSGGSITGESGTGGIAGQNSGTITGCINRSAVNTVHQEKELSLEDGLDSLNREDVLDTTMDTGGIAGYSNGVLRSCRNEGGVGYPHVGYNVGGIAGRSSGHLDGCVNAGTVQGRKDVGGVIGQMSPNVRLIFSQDTIGQLRDELDRLNAMVGTTLDHAGDSRTSISNRLDQLSDQARTASDSVSELSDIMSDWADSGIDTFNDAAGTLADTLDRLEQITDGGGDILDGMADGVDALEGGLDDLSEAMGLGGDGLDGLSESVRLLRKAVQQARDAWDKVRQALRDLSGALVVEDQEAVDRALELLETGTGQLSAALTQCGRTLDAIAELLKEGSPKDPELHARLTEYLSLLKDCCDAAAGAAAQIGQGVLTGLRGVSLDWSVVKESAQDAFTALKGYSDRFDALSRSMQSIQDALSGFAGMTDGLEDGLGGMSNAMDRFETAARDMGDMLDDIHALFQDLAGRDPVEFDKLGGGFHRAEDDLHSAITNMGDQMDLLREELDASGGTLSADIRALGDQFQVVSNLLLDAISDDSGEESGALWDDVSEEEINNTTLGKAKDCSNTGSVDGDLNVGGIAGSMSIESDFDPEEDITEVGEESLHFLYETRAILQDCRNSGAVTSKKNVVGGVVGNMALGYLLNCENYGTVASTNGNYTGGIAGYSRSAIRSCWSKCALSGGSYVGGVAGYGYEVYQCVSLVNVEEAGGYVGSVVGDWDRENGALRGNRFVEGPLAGVDGVSYSGQAEPVAYGELMLEEGVPEPFRYFTVTYVAEENVIETAVFSYRDALSSHVAPAVPEKEGYCGAWEEIGEEYITFDHVLNAVYKPLITTLASSAMRDAVHSVFLVEGTFDETADVQAEQAGSGDTELWTVTLTGTDEGEHRVRFTPPAEWKNVSLSLLTQDGKTAVQWEQEGSCCVFTVGGGSFVLEAARQGSTSFILWLIPAIAAAVIAVLFAVVWRRKGRRPSVPQLQTEEAAGADLPEK